MLIKIKYRKPGEICFAGKFCLLIISFVLISVRSYAQNGWTRKANTLHPRLGCCAVVVDNKIYVMGGIDGSLNNYNYNEVYDPLTDTWETKKSMPTVGGLVSVAVVEGIIYTLGGSVGIPGISEVFAYDPVSDTWNQRANLLAVRMGAAAGVVDGIIYNVGGNHTERNCEAYDRLTDTWTRKADIPETYGGVMVAPYNGLLYVFGGGYQNTFSTTFVYDPETNEWTKKTNMPTARGWSHPAPVVEGKIYIIGGYKVVRGEILSDIEVYDPDDDSWIKLPNAPFNRTFFGIAAVNDKIYLIGGTSDWATGLNEVWEYTPPSICVRQPFLDKPYAKPNTDSVSFRTRFSNPESLQFISNLIYSSSDGSQVDSVSLYDDGLHGDSLSNDGLFGAFIPPQTDEDFYTLSVSMIENQSQEYRIIYDDCRFTTAGPVILDSISFGAVVGYKYGFKPYLKNSGSIKNLTNIKLKLSSSDPWIKSITPTERYYSDMQPGQTVGGPQVFGIAYDSASFTGYFNLKFEISSNDCIYWVIDTTIIVIPTTVKNEIHRPAAFVLEQNYPNPFNPATTIGYILAEKSNVKLTLLNTLGEEIAVLINEEQEKGYHKVEFDGSMLTSGVYFYQLKAGSFIEKKKMILLR